MTTLQKTLIDIASKDIKDFCILNKIPCPKIEIRDKIRGYSGLYDPDYDENAILIAPDSCSIPVKNPGYAWSFPRYFVDRTCYGVLVHEFGHYVHLYLKYPKMVKEIPITGYEPNLGERFAETMKVFISNPDLLKNANPDRYAKLLKLGLKPSSFLPWKEALKDAHPKFIVACENRIARRKKGICS